jgi:histidine phosphotransfer protein HptB
MRRLLRGIEVMTTEQTTLNLDVLRQLFGDEDEIVCEILEIFAEDLLNNCAELRKAAEQEDRRRFGRVAHSLKGSSANVGASQFSALCHDAESASSEQPWAALREKLSMIVVAATALSEGVRGQVIVIKNR